MSYKNLLIWIGAPLVIIVLWVLVVYMPIDAQAKKGQNAINSILKERKDMETSIMTMSQQMQTQENLKRSYDDFLSQTPTIEKMAGFMANVVNAAKTRGMGVERLSGQYNTMDLSQKGIMNPVFELGLKGGFLDMGRFLEELSEKTAFKGVQKARIAYDERDYPVLSGRFVVEFKALKGRPLEGK